MANFFLIFNILLCTMLFGGYAVLICMYRSWFLKLDVFTPGQMAMPTTKFTVIIPARNEEHNIVKCIRSILNNNYPQELFEIIVADDFSTDRTPDIVRQLYTQHSNVHLIQLADFVTSKLNSYKKKAIEVAISNAKNDWVLTTDADCILPAQWLQLYDAYIQKTNPEFIAAPVMFHNTGSFISIFQCLDFLSLQGITAASVSAGFHSMCNGANLAYSKKAFNAVNGFKGVDDIASGDDMMLMHKINKAYPGKVGYLFSEAAICLTEPMPNMQAFINQRIRWASKASSYHDRRIFRVLLLVYLFNAYLLVMPFICVFFPMLWWCWLGMLAGKTLVELSFMFPVANFYNMQKLLWWFPVMQPFHILYTVVSGWLGKFGTYQWKGRTVK